MMDLARYKSNRGGLKKHQNQRLIEVLCSIYSKNNISFRARIKGLKLSQNYHSFLESPCNLFFRARMGGNNGIRFGLSSLIISVKFILVS